MYMVSARGRPMKSNFISSFVIDIALFMANF
jgi:hypothetical protein